MALSGISQTIDTPSYQSHAATATASGAFAAVLDPKADVGVLIPTADATVVDSGDMASIVSSMGAHRAGTPTYDAAGRLGSGVQVFAALDEAIPAYEQDLTHVAVTGMATFYGAADAPGIYTPSGALQELPLSAANDASNSIVNTLAY